MWVGGESNVEATLKLIPKLTAHIYFEHKKSGENKSHEIN